MPVHTCATFVFKRICIIKMYDFNHSSQIFNVDLKYNINKNKK
jgi:hypothetical protein